MKASRIIILISLFVSLLTVKSETKIYSLDEIASLSSSAVAPIRIYEYFETSKNLVKTQSISIPVPNSSTGYYCVSLIYFSNGFWFEEPSIFVNFNNGSTQSFQPQFSFVKDNEIYLSGRYLKNYGKFCFGYTDLVTVNSNIVVTISEDYFYFEKILTSDACPPTCKACSADGKCTECHTGDSSSVISFIEGRCECNSSPCTLTFMNYLNWSPNNCPGNLKYKNVSINYKYSYCSSENNLNSVQRFLSSVPFVDSELSNMNNILPFPNYNCGEDYPSSKFPGKICITKCDSEESTISAPLNGLSISVSIPPESSQTKVLFTDPANIISNGIINFNRYRVFANLTNSNGTHKMMLNVIHTSKVNSNPSFEAYIILDTYYTQNFCQLVDNADSNKGRRCFILLGIIDDCGGNPNEFTYSHFLEIVIDAGISFSMDQIANYSSSTVENFPLDGGLINLVKTSSISFSVPNSSTGYYCISLIFFSFSESVIVNFNNELSFEPHYKFQRIGMIGQIFNKYLGKFCFGNQELEIANNNITASISEDYFYFEKIVIANACPPACKSCNSNGTCTSCHPGDSSSIITLSNGNCNCSVIPCTLAFMNFFNYKNPNSCPNNLSYKKVSTNYRFSFCNVSPLPEYENVISHTKMELEDANNILPFPAYTCPGVTSPSIVEGELCTGLCSLPAQTISTNYNGFSISMSIPENTSSVKVLFSDSNNLLGNLNFERYYLRVYLTNNEGEKIFTQNSPNHPIQGEIFKENSAFIIVTENNVITNCKFVDDSEISKGRACYFLLVLTDSCKNSENLLYYHFAQRIINSDDNGVHIIQDISAYSPQILSIDYCKFYQNCFISTRYSFGTTMCTDSGNPCNPIFNPNYKYKKNSIVNIQIAFTNKEGNPVSGKAFSLTSLKAKLYSNTNQPINTPEREITIDSSQTVENKFFFSFKLSDTILLFSGLDLISSNIRLIIIVKLNNASRERNLEIDQIELVPQSGNLLIINFDPLDFIEFDKNITYSRTSKSAILIGSILGGALLLIIIGIVIYCILFRKHQKDKSSDNVESKRLNYTSKVISFPTEFNQNKNKDPEFVCNSDKELCN